MEGVVIDIKQEELHITHYGDTYVEDVKAICNPVASNTDSTEDSHTRGRDKPSLALLKPVKLELVRLDEWYPGLSNFVKVKQEPCDDEHHTYQEDTDQDPLAFTLEECLSKFRKIKTEEKVLASLQKIKVEEEEDVYFRDATLNEDWDSELTSTQVDHHEQQGPWIEGGWTSSQVKEAEELLNKDSESVGPCFKNTSCLVGNKKYNKTHNRVYDCNICSKTFSHRSGLWGHNNRIHLGLKHFKCAYCDKGFCEKGKLAIHIKTHTQQRPYKCNVCFPCSRSYVRTLPGASH